MSGCLTQDFQELLAPVINKYSSKSENRRFVAWHDKSVEFPVIAQFLLVSC
jgi:hypothetical protein